MKRGNTYIQYNKTYFFFFNGKLIIIADFYCNLFIFKIETLMKASNLIISELMVIFFFQATILSQSFLFVLKIIEKKKENLFAYSYSFDFLRLIIIAKKNKKLLPAHSFIQKIAHINTISLVYYSYGIFMDYYFVCLGL